MELKLEHLAPYLPYSLDLQFIIDGEVMAEETMCKIAHFEWEIDTKIGIGIADTEHIWMFKPLLRPLSQFGDSGDLRKVNEFIGLGKWCDAYDEYFQAWFNDSANINKLVLQAPYEIFQYFLSEHYDVFSLIENGLATIKE